MFTFPCRCLSTACATLCILAHIRGKRRNPQKTLFLEQAGGGSMTKHCFLLVWLLIPMAAWPQAGTSTVRGVVRDQAQAVIPGAKVILTNTGTTVARESQTNSSG